MVTGKSGYSASKSRKLAAARTAVRKAAVALRGRANTYSRAPPRTGGWYGVYQRRGRDELKFIDVSSVPGAISTGGSITLLNGVTQGTDWDNRIGRKFLMKSLLFRFTTSPNTGGSAPGGDVIRIIVFYDSQTNGVAPVPTDLLQNGTYDSPLNLANRDRFKVIIDKFVTMGANVYTAGNLTAGSPTCKQMNMFKKMSMEVINAGTGATVGSIQTGGLFLFVMSLNLNTTLGDFYSRVRYIDS
jgi:hypothetical protein